MMNIMSGVHLMMFFMLKTRKIVCQMFFPVLHTHTSSPSEMKKQTGIRSGIPAAATREALSCMYGTSSIMFLVIARAWNMAIRACLSSSFNASDESRGMLLSKAERSMNLETPEFRSSLIPLSFLI
jgi:hypothetical protein